MVRVQPGRVGGALGKLSGDPAVQTAAVALLHGWSDPLAFLALDGDDYAIAVAVVTAARDQRLEWDKQLADYQSSHTGYETAVRIVPPLSKTFSRVLANVARAMNS